MATNPGPDSNLLFLLRIPISGGLILRKSGTWPRAKAPVPVEEAADPDSERAALRSCARCGAAIDLVVDRGRENRSQIVFSRARGRDMVFWQSRRTRKYARPNVRTPTARAAGVAGPEIVVDNREQYAYKFAGQQVATARHALPAGDYGLVHDGRLVASVERKPRIQPH